MRTISHPFRSGLAVGAVVVVLAALLVAAPARAASAPVRVNAGGPARTVGGVAWSGCTAATSCVGARVFDGIAYAQQPVPAIQGAVAPTDAVVHQTEWTGGQTRGTAPGARAFGFDVPLQPGQYLVRLHFAELNKNGPGLRLFDVRLEGQTVLSSFDVWSAAGGIHRAIVRDFPVTVTDSQLDLDFITRRENAKVSAFEVLPAPVGQASPSPSMSPSPSPSPSPSAAPSPTARPAIRLNAGGPAQTVGDVPWDACASLSACSGRVAGGFPYAKSPTPAIAGVIAPASAALYQTEWTGGATNGVPAGAVAFSFRIPVTDGAYTVRLHFAENVQSGPGKRRFDVALEGATALRDFDIYAEAGGMNRALVRSFPVTVGDGALNVDFVRQVENAKVSAIEVVSRDAGSAPEPPPPSARFAWQTRAPSPIARFEAGGAPVGGSLYVLGGFVNGQIQSTARSDAYDPAADRWRRLRDMPVQLTHSPAVVSGGDIWLLGGFVGNHPGPSTADVWIYSTTLDTWRRGPSLPLRRGAGAGAIVGRRIHFYGGVDRAAGSKVHVDEDDHWVLDLDQQQLGWQRRASLPVARNHLGGGALDGQVYAVGGQLGENESSGNRAEVHRYDPAADRWTAVAPLPVPRGHTTASVFAHRGRLVVAGGTVNGNSPSADVTAYDPEANAWVRLPSLPSGRKTPVAGAIGDTWVIATGNGGGPTTTNWNGVLAESWDALPSMPVALGEVAGGVVGGGLFLVGEGSGATLRHDLGTGAWRSDLAQRPFKGHHHAAEVVGGRLHLFGGLGSGGGEVQIYDPAANRWTAGADMPFPAGSSSSAVIGGKVYVAGGIVGTATTRRTAVYDPATNRWTELAPMPAGRNHAASGTDGRRLYVFGGRGPGSGDRNEVANGFATVQVYDPATNRWATSDDPASGLRPLPQARGGMGRAVLVDGELLVMGGETRDGAGATSAGVYARVDRYDPVAGTWRQGTPMPTPRHGIFGVEVAGRVIVAGGGTRAGFSSSTAVEAYNPVRGTPTVQTTTAAGDDAAPVLLVRAETPTSASYSCSLSTSSA